MAGHASVDWIDRHDPTDALPHLHLIDRESPDVPDDLDWDLVRWSERVEAENEAELSPVHIADPRHHRLIKQQLRDRHPTTGERGNQPLLITRSDRERVRTNPREQTLLLIGVDHVACRRPRQVQGARLTAPAHPRALRRLGCLLRERSEAPKKAEMHVHCDTPIPSVEEVLADRLDTVECSPIDRRRPLIEPTLRRVDTESVAGEPPTLQTGRPVKGVPLRHRLDGARG